MSITVIDRSRSSRPPVPRLKGKFCSFKPNTEATRSKALKREVSLARKERRKNEIFDKFLCLFFLEGDESDWIPTSARSGPLVSLVRAIFKKSYVLDEGSRRDKVVRAYFGGEVSKIRPITTRKVTRDASLSNSDVSRPTVFLKRRLPRIENDSAEIQPVKEWLEQLQQCGALKENSVETVFASVISVIKSYVWVGRNRAYIGYPKPAKAKRIDEDGDTELIDLVRQDESSSGPGSLPAVVGSTDISDAPQPATVSAPMSSTRAQQEETDESAEDESHMHVFVAMACSDHTYAMFCAIFDKDLEHQFDVASGLFLMNKRDKESRFVPYLREIIMYLHWKNTGIKDPLAHKQRELKLRHIAGFLTTLREAYGMKTYSDIRWMFT